MISYIVIFLPDTLKSGKLGSVVKILEDIDLTCQGPVWMPLSQENVEGFYFSTDVLQVWKCRYRKDYAEKLEEFLMCAERGNLLMLRFFSSRIQVPVDELANEMRRLYNKYNVPAGSALLIEDHEGKDGKFRIVYDSPLEFEEC